MNKRAKLLEAMRNNPRDWRIDDLISVARQFDIGCRTMAVVTMFSAIRALKTMFPYRHTD